MREREALFSDFCSDLRRREKEEKSLQREKVGQWSRRKLSIFMIYRPQVSAGYINNISLDEPRTCWIVGNMLFIYIDFKTSCILS